MKSVVRLCLMLLLRLASTPTTKTSAQQTTEDHPRCHHWLATSLHSDLPRHRPLFRHRDSPLSLLPPSLHTRAVAVPAASPTYAPSAVSIATATLTTRLPWKRAGSCSGRSGLRRQKAARSGAFCLHAWRLTNAAIATSQPIAHRPHVTMTSQTVARKQASWATR